MSREGQPRAAGAGGTRAPLPAPRERPAPAAGPRLRWGSRGAPRAPLLITAAHPAAAHVTGRHEARPKAIIGGPKETLRREKREEAARGHQEASSGDVTRGHHEGSGEGNLVRRRRHGGNH